MAQIGGLGKQMQTVYTVAGSPQTLTGTSGINFGALPQTISINPFTTTGNLSTFDLSVDSEYVKKYEIYDIQRDLLSLSCTWYRLRKTQQKLGYAGGSLGIASLLDKSLFESVKPEDDVLAADIRDYYSKKIMMWKLKNTHMSKYRDDMNTFIHGDGTKVTKDFFGLVYNLPKFYFYDKEIDIIFADKNKNVENTQSLKQVKNLNLIRQTELDKRSLAKQVEYWFSDEDNNVVRVGISLDNPLRNVWEKLIQDPIKLEAHYFRKHKDDKYFLNAEKYNLV